MLESFTQLLFGVRLVNYSFDSPHTRTYTFSLDFKMTMQNLVDAVKRREPLLFSPSTREVKARTAL